jgi:hypothetical protein
MFTWTTSSYFYQAYAAGARDNVILWLIGQSVIAINGRYLSARHVHPQANEDQVKNKRSGQAASMVWSAGRVAWQKLH